MTNCEHFRAQLLESLYDLLDEADKQAVAAHLEGCPACQAELNQARRQQGLFAAAARMEFPNVQFTPPESGITAAPAVVLPMPTQRKPARRVWRWVAAAAVLLVLGGLGGVGWWSSADYRAARRTVERSEQQVANAGQAIEQTIKKLNDLPTEQNKRQQEIIQEVNKKKVQVSFRGPEMVHVGTTTTYLIETRDLNNAPVNTRVTAEVRNGAQVLSKAVEVKPTENTTGQYSLTLPPDLPIRPGMQPTLVVAAKGAGEAGSEAVVREELKLTAPVYVTHLTTDKPMYLPGETVHFRSLTLDRTTLKPPQEDFHLLYTLTLPLGGEAVLLNGKSQIAIQTPSGQQIVRGPDGQPVRGIGAGEWAIPANADGGEYTLTVRDEHSRFPEQRRKFLVNRYQKPRLDKKLDYNRTTYGPGDEVMAHCEAKITGKPLVNAPVAVRVEIDGHSYGPDGKPFNGMFPLQTDAQGAVNVRFKLPQEIDRGQAALTVKFEDEPIVRPIPIVLKKLNVEFYPEGGYLVTDLVNRVYFQVRTPLGKPAELKGRLLEDGKPTDVVLETLHDDQEPGVNQGMGRFEFTPRVNKVYTIEVDQPSGVTQKFALPAAETNRVVLTVPSGVFTSGDAIPVIVRSSSKRTLLIGAYCRGRLLDTAEVGPIHFNQGVAKAELKPTSGEGGVCRVTVFEVTPGGARRVLKPVAERLVYRQPRERLDITLTPDKQMYVPRDTAKLGVSVKNEKGEAAPAILMLAVVDKSVLTMADEKTARTMPTHFLLTTEVRRPEDLEYADFLLGSHPKATAALDLLLGTQGWRRFAEQDPGEFLQKHKEEAERLLVTMGRSNEKVTNFVQEEFTRVDEEIAAKRTELNSQLQAARDEADAAHGDPAYLAALGKFNSYNEFFDRNSRRGAPIAAGLLFVVMMVLLFFAVRRRAVAALVHYAAVAACACGIIVVVKFAYDHRGGAGAYEDRKLAELKDVSAPQATGDNGPRHAGQGKQAEVFGDQPWDVMKEVAEHAPEGKDGGKGGAGALLPGADPAAVPAVAPPPAPPPGVALPPVEGPDAAKADVKALEFEKGKEAKKLADRDVDARFMVGLDDENGLLAKKPQAVGAGGKRAFPPGMVPPMAPGRPVAGGVPGGGPFRGGIGGGGFQGGIGGFGGMPGDGLQADFARRRELREQLAMMPPLVVREYAHPALVNRATSSTDKLRTDWTETLYWHPVLVLPDGKTDVKFNLCDSVTSFEALAYAHSLDGRLGAAKQVLVSRLPITVRHKTPIEVTAGDRIELPVSITNNTDRQMQVQLRLTTHDNLDLLKADKKADLAIDADKTSRHLFGFRPQGQEGQAKLGVEARTGGFDPDSAQVAFRIVPEGFPIVAAKSDVLETSATQTVTLPETWVKGTLQVKANVYPSTLADLQKGLEAMLREPCGCFEQTSTSNYPNILVLDYLKESDQAKPEVERRARDLLARGYGMLTGFECTNSAKKAREGYEWFGGTAPAHEALTAYGLMEFRDMARVQEVDQAMVKRTSEYLLSRRDGKGGFLRNDRALDTFGAAPPDITNAYIVWALTESGKDDDVTKELQSLNDLAAKSKDPYFLALVANSLINRARTADGTKLLEKVAAAQKEDGHLDGESTSITHSAGRDLQIETTALAVLGWLKANPGTFQQPLSKAIKWLGQQRGGYGGFGSTQATILTLKALIAYTRANKKTAEAGTLRMFVGEQEVAKLDFSAGAADALTLAVPNAEEVLKPGKNKVRVEITGKNVFPYTLTWSYQTLQPASADNCPVRLETSLARTEVKEGDSVRMTVKVANVSGKGQGMAVAIVGLPGGLGLPEDMKQLKEYIRVPEDGSRPLVSAFEVRGRELVLYWRDMAPDQKIEVPVDLICRVPGEYSGPASRAYLYYNADHKHWVAPLKATIKPQAE
jgi:anti-sigma factor RsiW